MARTASGEWAGLLGREAACEPDAAFTLLVQRHSRFVFSVAYAVLRNAEDSEDVVQDMFLKLFRTGAWKEIEDERRFLARAVWRLAISKKPRGRLITESEWEKASADESSPERSAILNQRSRTIHKLIDALPQRLRRPLALSSLQDMTSPEIADIMNLPEGTVRRLLTEARALLKEKLSRLEGGHHG